GRFSAPVKTFLNCTMPELANMRVGSLRGTSGDEATTSCPCFRKKSRKVERICARPVMCHIQLERRCAVLRIEGGPVHKDVVPQKVKIAAENQPGRGSARNAGAKRRKGVLPGQGGRRSV